MFSVGFFKSDFVNYTQVVQQRFHSVEFCAGLSCTPAPRSNKDSEASLTTPTWTEFSSLSKTQKVTANWGRKYKRFKEAHVGIYREAVKKNREREKKTHFISSPASGSTWGQKVSSVRAIILLSVKAVRPAEVPSPASSVWFALCSCKSVSSGA